MCWSERHCQSIDEGGDHRCWDCPHGVWSRFTQVKQVTGGDNAMAFDGTQGESVALPWTVAILALDRLGRKLAGHKVDLPTRWSPGEQNSVKTGVGARSCSFSRAKQRHAELLLGKLARLGRWNETATALAGQASQQRINKIDLVLAPQVGSCVTVILVVRPGKECGSQVGHPVGQSFPANTEVSCETGDADDARQPLSEPSEQCQRAMASNRATRSGMGGWVENSRVNPSTRKGLAIIKWLDAVSSGSGGRGS